MPSARGFISPPLAPTSASPRAHHLHPCRLHHIDSGCGYVPADDLNPIQLPATTFLPHLGMPTRSEPWFGLQGDLPGCDPSRFHQARCLSGPAVVEMKILPTRGQCNLHCSVIRNFKDSLPFLVLMNFSERRSQYREPGPQESRKFSLALFRGRDLHGYVRQIREVGRHQIKGFHMILSGELDDPRSSFYWSARLKMSRAKQKS